jgi:hypothetical protein
MRKLEKAVRKRQKAAAKRKTKKGRKLICGELDRRRKWTPQDIHELELLARARIPVELIAVELQRTNSIRATAAREGIALVPARKKSLPEDLPLSKSSRSQFTSMKGCSRRIYAYAPHKDRRNVGLERQEDRR